MARGTSRPYRRALRQVRCWQCALYCEARRARCRFGRAQNPSGVRNSRSREREKRGRLLKPAGSKDRGAGRYIPSLYAPRAKQNTAVCLRNSNKRACPPLVGPASLRPRLILRREQEPRSDSHLAHSASPDLYEGRLESDTRHSQHQLHSPRPPPPLVSSVDSPSNDCRCRPIRSALVCVPCTGARIVRLQRSQPTET